MAKFEEVGTSTSAVITFHSAVPSQAGHLMHIFEVQVMFRPLTNIHQMLGSVKDDLGLHKPGFYKIVCV